MDFLDKTKDFVNLYKVNLVMVGGLLLLIFFGNFTVYYLLANNIKESNNYELDTSVYIEKEDEDKEETIEEIFYKVDIKGAVNNPGVYELKSSSRVIEVINLAGGLNEFADTSVTNLSKFITDEMVIVIYTKDEVSSFNEVIKEEEKEEKECIIYNEIIQNDSCKDNIANDNSNDSVNDEQLAIDTKVSINTADITLLMTLPGIGESKAKSIIEYREKEGKFNSIEDITNVSGIGEKLFEEIKDYITV